MRVPHSHATRLSVVITRHLIRATYEGVWSELRFTAPATARYLPVMSGELFILIFHALGSEPRAKLIAVVRRKMTLKAFYV